MMLRFPVRQRLSEAGIGIRHIGSADRRIRPAYLPKIRRLARAARDSRLGHTDIARRLAHGSRGIAKDGTPIGRRFAAHARRSHARLDPARFDTMVA